METTTTTIVTTVKTIGATTLGKRKISNGSRTINFSGHISLAMNAIGSAANLPPLQYRGINNAEVDNRNA